MEEEWNPNGSYYAIEGITSADGRIYGKMAHPERIGAYVNINIPVRQDMKIFESGVAYFKSFEYDKDVYKRQEYSSMLWREKA